MRKGGAKRSENVPRRARLDGSAHVPFHLPQGLRCRRPVSNPRGDSPQHLVKARWAVVAVTRGGDVCRRHGTQGEGPARPRARVPSLREAGAAVR